MAKLQKKLARSKRDRKIAGVCAGIADYFDIDPTLVRIVFIFLGVPGGAPGILIYLALWLIMPEA